MVFNKDTFRVIWRPGSFTLSESNGVVALIGGTVKTSPAARGEYLYRRLLERFGGRTISSWLLVDMAKFLETAGWKLDRPQWYEFIRAWRKKSEIDMATTRIRDIENFFVPRDELAARDPEPFDPWAPPPPRKEEKVPKRKRREVRKPTRGRRISVED
ncbi:MAG: hypothetical protein GYA36_19320 [Veillonellaceae bacterium]|nr:hypothetical protein [Veillonellaceae bacterium]